VLLVNYSLRHRANVRHPAGVLLLSRLLGEDACTVDGGALGRVADVSARLGAAGQPTLVDRILLHRRQQSHILVPATAVESIARSSVRLKSDETDYSFTSIDEALGVDEILLVRDVLDTQIVDVAGQRLARVADVVLAHRRDIGIEIIGVEAGFGGVLRRLGFGRLARRLPADAVAWSDLHLTSGRGHTVQVTMPRSATRLLDARGLARLVARLDTQSATEVLAAKEANLVAEVIRTSHPAVGERMLRAMPDFEAARVVGAMPAHHADHWRRVLAAPRFLRGRNLLRSRVWPRQHLARKALE
jgi:hypothetical protein